MLITELINYLRAALEDHGNVEVGVDGASPQEGYVYDCMVEGVDGGIFIISVGDVPIGDFGDDEDNEELGDRLA